MSNGTLRIGSAKNLAYAPQYLTEHLGFFADEGLDVDFVVSPPGASSIVSHLRQGEIDLVLGSVLFVDAMAKELDGDVEIVAQINRNSRHFLMARRQDPPWDFSWGDLKGRTIVVAPTFVPTSWIAFREALYRNRVSLDEVNLIIGFQPQHVVDEFVNGVAALLLIGGEEGDDERLVTVAPLADGYGPVPWSVYCASRTWAEGAGDRLRQFRRALSRGQNWLYAHSADDISDVLDAVFDEIDTNTIKRTVDLYLGARFWADTSAVDLGALQEWQDALIRWGMISPQTDVVRLASLSR